MLIKMTRDGGDRLRAVLRILKPLGVEIELEITSAEGNDSEERAMLNVSRIIDDMQFCGWSACGCAECARHQLDAMIRYCEGQAELSSCKLSAVVRLGGKQERVSLASQRTVPVATKALAARAAAIGG